MTGQTNRSEGFEFLSTTRNIHLHEVDSLPSAANDWEYLDNGRLFVAMPN